MSKKQCIFFGIALVLLFLGIALATSNSLSASSDVEMHIFDQNSAERDYGNESKDLKMPVIISFLIAAIAALLGGIVGAIATYLLGERRKKQKLLKALKEEIEDNVERMEELFKKHKGEFDFLCFAPFRFYIDSYVAARTTGILADFPKERRNKLVSAYALLIFLNDFSSHKHFDFRGYGPEDENRILNSLENGKKELSDLIQYLS